MVWKHMTQTVTNFFLLKRVEKETTLDKPIYLRRITLELFFYEVYLISYTLKMEKTIWFYIFGAPIFKHFSREPNTGKKTCRFERFRRKTQLLLLLQVNYNPELFSKVSENLLGKLQTEKLGALVIDRFCALQQKYTWNKNKAEKTKMFY